MLKRSQLQTSPSSGGEDQNYMASAADLMIGLLFVFIIMVAFLALQNKTEKEASEGDKDPRGTVTLAIGNEIKNTLQTVTIDPASGVITLPEELLFDSGSSELKDTAIQRLGETSVKLTEVLKCFVANKRVNSKCKNNPYGHEIETIFIEGHTDSRPMNKVGGNTKLSLDRAISVNNSLVYGTPLTEFRNHQGHPIFSYSAYAENRPLIKNDPTDGRNRRVDLRIVLTYRPIANVSTPIESTSKAISK